MLSPRVWVVCLVLLTGLPSCKKKTSDTVETVVDARVAPAAEPVAAVDAGPSARLTPAERLEQHRKEMADAAEAGRYADVCKGTPWFNSTICNWAAAKAAGKSVDRPNGELFRAYFGKEHWKHAYGRIVGDADKDGDYEVSVGGYNHHCILDTIDTKYDTKGAFNLWVQEQPEPREVTLNSGNTQQWVVLEEAELAKTLMDLAHAGGVEATAMAKNAMKLIAEYQPYSERKGEPPTLPDAPGSATATAAAAPGSGGPPSMSVDALPKAGAPGPISKPGSAVQGPATTPTCPAGSTWNGTSCAGNVPATAAAGAFNPGAAAGALGSVNPRTCRGLGVVRGAGHVSVTFAPDGSVSNAVVDQPPFAGTPMAGCISNAYRMIRVPAFTGAPVTVGKGFMVN
jgi:hypothetical protein